MAANTDNLSYWLEKYEERFNDTFPVIIGWNGDRIETIKKCLQNDTPADIEKMEADIENTEVLY